MRRPPQHLSIVRQDAASRLQADILDRTRVHTETVRRLISDPTVEPLQLAAYLEDVANIYLNLSEELSRSAYAPPEQ